MKKLVTLALVAACGGGDEETCDPTIVGDICTIAGSGKSGYAGDGGRARDAKMSLPQDTLAVGDVLYILDWNNHRIRKLMPDGSMQHVAGRGELGGTLDDPANSDLNHPTGILHDQARNRLLIAAWHNSKLREVDLASGEIFDSCGDGRRAYFGDEGPALTATLDLPASLAFAPNGDVVIMDQANQVLRRVDAAGTIHRMAGKCVVDAAPPLGMGPCAPGVEPQPCPSPSGKFYCGGLAACMAPCTPGYAGDDGPALDMRIAQPFGQSADPAGRIVYDTQGNLVFADTSNQIIRKIDTQGIVKRIAGTPGQAGYADGPALSAQFNNPVDLALDTDGTIYVSDVYNHCIRAIAPDQTVRTVAGVCGEAGNEGDGGPATAAKLKRPYGIELANGTLYIADTGNHVIRSIRLR